MQPKLYSLTQKNLETLQSCLSSFSTVMAPQQNEQGNLSWQPMHESPTAFYGNTLLSPKQYFFPQYEKLFAFKGKKGKVEITTLDETAESICFWGIRPCDLKAIHLLDKIFLTEKFTDQNYQAKRENAYFVSFFCPEPYETCFCTSLNYDLFDNTVYDFLIFPLQEGDEYLAMISKRGEELLHKAGLKKHPVSPTQQKVFDQFMKNFQTSFTTQFDLPKQLGELKHFFEDDHYFEKAAMKCLGCGICTFFCPTCHCFTLVDSHKKDTGCRARCWDCCTSPDFTLMAGGHNPRDSKAARIRQRFLHKGYYFEEAQSELGCVGCGRCLSKCPVSMDICDGIQHVRGKDK